MITFIIIASIILVYFFLYLFIKGSDKKKIVIGESSTLCSEVINTAECSIFYDKKSNSRYWDGLDALTEEYIKALVKSGYDINECPTQLSEDSLLELQKEVLDFTVERLLTEGVYFPYVDENL